MSKIRCTQCKGQKKYAAMGNIIKNCLSCDSNGMIDYVEKQDIAQTNVENAIADTTLLKQVNNVIVTAKKIVAKKESADSNVPPFIEVPTPKPRAIYKRKKE